MTVRGQASVPIAEEAPELTNVGTRPPGSPRQLRGWYGLLDISRLNWVGAPASVDPTGYSHLGYRYGLRAGYRLLTPVEVKAVIGITHHDVTGKFQDSVGDCAAGTTNQYQLDTRSAGGALRLMSGGESTRFTSAIGMGAALQDFTFVRSNRRVLTPISRWKRDCSSTSITLSSSWSGSDGSRAQVASDLNNMRHTKRATGSKCLACHCERGGVSGPRATRLSTTSPQFDPRGRLEIRARNFVVAALPV